MKYFFGGLEWNGITLLVPKQFICWNCGNNISSNQGYRTNLNAAVHICHTCNAPNIFNIGGLSCHNIFLGKDISKLPSDVDCLYNEARACISVKAFTAATMLFRKILMNFAVIEGAEENESFKHYVDYLCNNGLVHKKQKDQADVIRKLGNDANHQIENRTEEEAMNMLKFIEFVLLNNYEFADDTK